MLSVELFAATHAIESCSIRNGCLGNIELPLFFIENVSYFFSSWQSSSKLALLMTYRKYSKSSLLYIIQCFKFSNEVNSF